MVKFTYSNFVNGNLNPEDFKLRFVLRRIQRFHANEKNLIKVLDAKTKDEAIAAGPCIVNIKSWYYNLNIVCDEFNEMLIKALGNNISSDIRKKRLVRIKNSKSFGILTALIWSKSKAYKIRQFKSLADCQRWIDKNGLNMKVDDIYCKD